MRGLVFLAPRADIQPLPSHPQCAPSTGRFRVKRSLPEECVADLGDGARRLGIQLDHSVLVKSCRYLGRILELNELHNLTRIHESGSAVRLHLLDSLTPIPEVNAAPEGRLLDIGTGGGFPGVPLALATARSTVLLDSSQKKIGAVSTALADVGIGDVLTVAARAEEYALREPDSFAVVVARAVAPLSSLAELAAPFLVHGGRAVFLKGAPEVAELDAGDRVGVMLGLERIGTRAFMLPGASERRTIVVFERKAPPTIALPRRVGNAQKRPLG